MSEIDLDAVEALCAKATPGPWRCGFNDDSGAPDGYEGGWIVVDDDAVVVRGGRDGDWPLSVGVLREADWRFIAAARTLVPQLLARCRAAEADAARLDWLESQGHGRLWRARESSTDRGYRLHNSTSGELSVRAAIDAARAGS